MFNYINTEFQFLNLIGLHRFFVPITKRSLVYNVHKFEQKKCSVIFFYNYNCLIFHEYQSNFDKMFATNVF
jgi:hypothetical protein